MILATKLDDYAKPKQEIGSEDCDSQKRQKFRLAIAVKDQACDNQQLYLKCSKRREIIGSKYDYDEYAELPRCESHAAPLVIAENLSIQPRGGRRDELFTAVPWSGTGGTAENICSLRVFRILTHCGHRF